MKILYPKTMGICGNEHFGVVKALSLVESTAKKFPGKTYLLGEVVHNPVVVKRCIEEWGVKLVQTIEEIPNEAVLVIRAHGATPEIYLKAAQKKLEVVDATCAIVSAVHRRVINLVDQGKRILYVASEATHDEAVGVKGEKPYEIKITTLAELANIVINNPKNVVVITQSTLAVGEVEKSLKDLKLRYPEITIEKHICMATTERQRGIDELMAQGAEAILVVGDKSSSNSMRLVEVARSKGMKSWLVNNEAEIPRGELADIKILGITAGASATPWLIEEIVEKLNQIK